MLLPYLIIVTPRYVATLLVDDVVIDVTLKHKNIMRFVMPDGRQILLQASDQEELNEWISRINYASAFKSAGVRIRALGMSPKDVELTGVAAATSHLRDSHYLDSKAPAWDGDAPHLLMGMLSGGSHSLSQLSPSNRRFTMLASSDVVDLEGPAASETEDAEQFKATFDQIKAELATGTWLGGSLTGEPVESTTISPTSISGQSSGLPSRSEIIRSKVRELDSRISATQTQLDSHLRFVRNIGTLTPFQKSTRDRLEAAMHDIAKKVMQVRLDMTRLVCHREVLASDLIAAGRDWHRDKCMAMKAATQTLQGQEQPKLPRMTLSFHQDEDEMPSSQSILPSPHRPESTCESFHSALDLGPEWPPCSDDIASSSFLNVTRSDPATRSGSSSSASLPYFETDGGNFNKNSTLSAVSQGIGHWMESATSPRNSEERGSHEKFHVAQEVSEEQAEEWNKTRAAQRVSLVRLPSGLQMSTLFEKHALVPRTAKRL
jgi:hypothetical protein